MDSINKDIRSNNNNIKFLEQQISEQKSEKEAKVPEFEAIDQKMLKMMEMQNNIQSKFKMLENLSNLSYKLLSLEKDISITGTELNCLKVKISNFDINLVNKLDNLQQLKNNLNSIIVSITWGLKQKNLLDNIKNFDINKANLLDDIMFLKEKLISYSKNIKEISNDKKQIDELLFNLTNQKKDLLKDYDKCPLCGGIING